MHSSMATADSSTKNYAIQKFVVDEANRQNIDPALALAIAKVESDFNPSALSHAGAKGVMQIMPATAEGVFGISSDRLFDAKINIELGISFIKKLLARYDQRTDVALSHYNGGSAVQNKSGGLTVIPATQKYVDKVLSAREHFKYKAYQLSDTPIQATFNENLITKESINGVSIKGEKQSKVLLNADAKDQRYAKKTIKKNEVIPHDSFDKQRYEKVEQLRTLRLHNIMRNTKDHTLVNNRTDLAENKLAKTKVETVLKEEISLSEKRIKVLGWEKMFN
uniref:Soluble lytic murein transglycosylase n=1 Tax=Colwellia sp. C1 TaxID=1737566 RepID=A0A168PGW9_9GAMM|nr:Soluble lytic murein transglycosylase precursor [Colwellia sp. C1]